MIVAALVAALSLSPAAGPSGAAPTHQLTACRVVRGRMALWNGAPTVRIWVIGTRRILGIVQRDNAFDQLPAPIRKLWDGKNHNAEWNTVIYGDFKVCARAPMRRGQMQMVTVMNARRLVLRPRR